MVFVSAAVTQSSALGVALAFFAEIHLGTHVSPDLGAVVLALGTTLLLMMDPARLRLTRESVLGLAYALDRKQFGQAIFEFPRVHNKLAMMAAEIMGVRQLTYFAAPLTIAVAVAAAAGVATVVVRLVRLSSTRRSVA